MRGHHAMDSQERGGVLKDRAESLQVTRTARGVRLTAPTTHVRYRPPLTPCLQPLLAPAACRRRPRALRLLPRWRNPLLRGPRQCCTVCLQEISHHHTNTVVSHMIQCTHGKRDLRNRPSGVRFFHTGKRRRKYKLGQLKQFLLPKSR